MTETGQRKREKRTRVPLYPLPKRAFSLSEAAYYCAVPEKTIYEALQDLKRVKNPEGVLEARERFPAHALAVKKGKVWVFERADLDKWLDTLFAGKGERGE